MDDRLADEFEQCLVRLNNGASIEECLAAFPASRAELEPALRAAVAVARLPRPAMPAATRAALEARMLDLAAARRATSTSSAVSPRRSFAPEALLASLLRFLGYRAQLNQPWMRPLALALALVLALLLSAGAIAAARAIIGASAVPAPTATITPITTTQPVAPVSLSGPAQQIDARHWNVGGYMVLIDDRTAIVGAPSAGAAASVRAEPQPDGSFLALSITFSAPEATSVVTPTLAPTLVPTPTTTLTPTLAPTLTPAPVLDQLIVPSPTAQPAPAQPAQPAPAQPAPQPAPAQPAPAQPAPQPAPAPAPQNDNNCRGQETGRDTADRKCDPKPKDDKPKEDKKDDKQDKPGKPGKP